MILKALLESYPKIPTRFHRNFELKLESYNLVWGAKGIGKTALVLRYYKDTKNPLYINLKDCRLNPKEDLKSLWDFCQNQSITCLILDNYTPDFQLPQNLTSLLPNLNLTLISQIPYEIPHFHTLEIPPITFREYYHSHKIPPQEAFSAFIKYGNLYEAEFLQEYKGEFLKNLCEDKVDFWILKNLLLCLGQKVSSHQIFTKLKKEGRLSKDRFYEYCGFLKASRRLFWVEKFEHHFAPKKLYFWDFTLKNAISFERNFTLLFENMVFLELLYTFKNQVFYTDKLDFYLPQSAMGILCVPFIQPQILEQKLAKITKEREFCDKFMILNLNESRKGESLGMPYEILPFHQFALQN